MKIGKAQRRVILALDADGWRKAPDHQAAKRLWYRKGPPVLFHRHLGGNAWMLTELGAQLKTELISMDESK